MDADGWDMSSSHEACEYIHNPFLLEILTGQMSEGSWTWEQLQNEALQMQDKYITIPSAIG